MCEGLACSETPPCFTFSYTITDYECGPSNVTLTSLDENNDDSGGMCFPSVATDASRRESLKVCCTSFVGGEAFAYSSSSRSGKRRQAICYRGRNTAGYRVELTVVGLSSWQRVGCGMLPNGLAASPEACVTSLEEETAITVINGPDGDPDQNFCQCQRAPDDTSATDWEFVPLQPGYEIIPFYVHNVELSYDYDTSKALIEGSIWIGMVLGLVLCCGLGFYAWRRALRNLLLPSDDPDPSSDY